MGVDVGEEGAPAVDEEAAAVGEEAAPVEGVADEVVAAPEGLPGSEADEQAEEVAAALEQAEAAAPEGDLPDQAGAPEGHSGINLPDEVDFQEDDAKAPPPPPSPNVAATFFASQTKPKWLEIGKYVLCRYRCRGIYFGDLFIAQVCEIH